MPENCTNAKLNKEDNSEYENGKFYDLFYVRGLQTHTHIKTCVCVARIFNYKSMGELCNGEINYDKVLHTSLEVRNQVTLILPTTQKCDFFFFFFFFKLL